MNSKVLHTVLTVKYRMPVKVECQINHTFLLVHVCPKHCMGHIYSKKLFGCIRNSKLIGHPVLLFGESGNPVSGCPCSAPLTLVGLWFFMIIKLSNDFDKSQPSFGWLVLPCLSISVPTKHFHISIFPVFQFAFSWFLPPFWFSPIIYLSD